MNLSKITIIIVLMTVLLRPMSANVEYKQKPCRNVSKSINAFAVDLYKEISKEQEGNFFFSPYSITMALSLAYSGATGETAKEFEKVLYIDYGKEKFQTEMSELIKSLSSRKDCKLETANAIWQDDDFQVQQEYIDNIKDYFASEVGIVDFNDANKSAEIINKWVKDKTENTIDKIVKVDDISCMTQLILANAVYFEAEWSERFPKEETKLCDFHLGTKHKTQVDMMSTSFRWSKEDYNKSLGDGYQMAKKHYKEKLAFVILLPEEMDGLNDIEQKLNSKMIDKSLNRLFPGRRIKSIMLPERPIFVSFYLPKFKTQSSFVKMTANMKELGLKKAFSSNAEFGKISKFMVSFNRISHKTFIEVNEEKTIASAVTVLDMLCGASSDPISKRITIRADHPFLYFIVDINTNAILFMGRLMEPTELN